MGKAIFIVPVPDLSSLREALADIKRHNEADCTDEGLWDVGELENWDPMRAKMFSMMGQAVRDKLSLRQSNESRNPPSVFGFKGPIIEDNSVASRKFSRGENISTTSAVFLRFRGNFWFEVTNLGGGAYTSKWLSENSTLGWVGTQGNQSAERGVFNQTPVITAALWPVLEDAYQQLGALEMLGERLMPGTRVMLQGLINRPDLNGIAGKLGEINFKTLRYEVIIPASNNVQAMRLTVKMLNLQKLE
jgi:hypothetical protein